MLSPLSPTVGREWVPKHALPLLAGCSICGSAWISLGHGAQPWPGPVTFAEGSPLWAVIPCSSQDADFSFTYGWHTGEPYKEKDPELSPLPFPVAGKYHCPTFYMYPES